MSEVYSHLALEPGTMIQEFRITRVLGIGSFGIVYAAENTYLDETVAIKEFLPTELAYRTEGKQVKPLSSKTEESYHWALEQFLKEAKILWALARPVPHPNIVRVTRYQEENGTAYMFMEYESGVPLSEVLEERRTLPEEELRSSLLSVLEGLGRVHVASVLHRDIKPANILIRDDGSPVLIDFGAARLDFGDGGRSALAVYSPVYAAPEQLSPMAKQGPWTDIYALGVTLYRAVTGQLPPSASQRMEGKPHVPAVEAAKARYSKPFLEAIDAALQLEPQNRPQSVQQWGKLFLAKELAEELAATVLTEGSESDTPTLLITPEEGSQTSTSIVPPESHPALGGESVVSVDRPEQQATDRQTGRPRLLLWGLLTFLTLAIAALGIWHSWPLLQPAKPPVEPMTDADEKPATRLTERPEVEPTADKITPVADAAKAMPDAPPGTVSSPPTTASVAPMATRAEESDTGPHPTTAPPVVLEPPVDRQTLTAAIERVLGQLECARVTKSLTPELEVRLAGHVSSTKDLHWARSQIKKIKGVTRVLGDVTVYERPFCEVINVASIVPIGKGSAGQAPRLTLNNTDHVYREGDFLEIRVETSSVSDGYLYLDYVGADGYVVHILPAPLNPDNSVRSGQVLHIGKEDSEQRYEVVAPHGNNLILATWSRNLLFDDIRPQVETVADYLPSLQAALRGQSATATGRVTNSYVFLVTQE